MVAREVIYETPEQKYSVQVWLESDSFAGGSASGYWRNNAFFADETLARGRARDLEADGHRVRILFEGPSRVGDAA